MGKKKNKNKKNDYMIKSIVADTIIKAATNHSARKIM